MQELFELILGNMTIEECEKRFLEMLGYVDFIQYENFKYRWFLNGLPTFYKEKITYDEPHTRK